MPVAVWWLGDLPDEQAEYVETLLDPADRLIVDSTEFNSPTDLAWKLKIRVHSERLVRSLQSGSDFRQGAG